MALINRKPRIEAEPEQIKFKQIRIERDITKACSCGRPNDLRDTPPHCPFCGKKFFYCSVKKARRSIQIVDGERMMIEIRCFLCRACSSIFYDDQPCMAPPPKPRAPSRLEQQAARAAARRGYSDDIFGSTSPQLAPADATIEEVAGHKVAMTDEQREKARDILGPLIRKYQRGDTQDGDRDN